MGFVSSMTAAGAIVSASIAGGIFARAAYERVRDFGRASSLLADSFQSHVLLQLQKGIPALDRISEKLMRAIPLFAEAAERASASLEERGLRFSERTLVSLLLGAAICVVAIGWVVSGSPVFGIAAGAIMVIGVPTVIKSRGEKRDAALREEIPDAIRSLEMSFRSGHSLPQTLAVSAKECTGYLGQVFAVSADRLELGAPTTEALANMCNNPRVPELSFVAVALDIQHQSGGSIGPVLESAMDTVEGELKLMRNLRIQTAQAKLSATIVTIMPFVLMALFSIMSPDFLAPFFSSVLGIGLLLIALAMQFAGVMTVRKMLKVDAL